MTVDLTEAEAIIIVTYLNLAASHCTQEEVREGFRRLIDKVLAACPKGMNNLA